MSVRFWSFFAVLLFVGCQQVDGQIRSNSGLLGTWQVELTRCARQPAGVVLTDKNPPAKKLSISKSGSRHQVVLSVLAGCANDWRTVKLSPKICTPFEVELRSEGSGFTGRAAFECELPDIGVVKGALRFTGCR